MSTDTFISRTQCNIDEALYLRRLLDKGILLNISNSPEENAYFLIKKINFHLKTKGIESHIGSISIKEKIIGYYLDCAGAIWGQKWFSRELNKCISEKANFETKIINLDENSSLTDNSLIITESRIIPENFVVFNICEESEESIISYAFGQHVSEELAQSKNLNERLSLMNVNLSGSNRLTIKATPYESIKTIDLKQFKSICTQLNVEHMELSNEEPTHLFLIFYEQNSARYEYNENSKKNIYKKFDYLKLELNLDNQEKQQRFLAFLNQPDVGEYLSFIPEKTTIKQNIHNNLKMTQLYSIWNNNNLEKISSIMDFNYLKKIEAELKLNSNIKSNKLKNKAKRF